MTLLAVAPGKFESGLRADGYAYRKEHRTGTLRQLPAVSVDLETTSLDRVLSDYYPTDAHFTCYIARRAGVPVRRLPRINKAGLAVLEAHGYLVTLEVLCADLDNPDHAAWQSPEHAKAGAERVAALLVSAVDEESKTERLAKEGSPCAAVYATTHGLRVIQPLARAVPVDRAEIVLRVWLAHLEAVGLSPDWSCADWTRCFRCPNVLRDGKPYRSPAIVDRSRPIEAPAGAAVVRPRASRSRALPVDAPAVSRELAPAWQPLAARLARPLAAHASDSGNRHAMSLSIAGALLRARVPAEQVPALVQAAVLAAGWPRDRAEEWFQSGVDTVLRWANRDPISTDLPEAVREELELGTDRRRAELAAAAQAAPRSSHDLAATTERLQRTIEEAPEGLTVIRAQCGLGKTHAARAVAVIRAARGGVRSRDSKTAISVPTTELALQVTNDLRAAGVSVLRLFGPLSVRGAHDGYECRFRASAAELAIGGQSVRAAYCTKCEHRNDCQARDGQDGEKEARVLVGPHALLPELDELAGSTGLLFIDEPPAVLEDEVFALDDLIAAEQALPEHFEGRYAAAMGCALRAVRDFAQYGAEEQPGPLARAFDLGVDPDLELAALEATGADSAHQAVALALGEKQHAPPISSSSLIASRRSLTLARKLGQASRVLRCVQWALTRPGVSATIYDRQGRRLVLTGVSEPLARALRGEASDGSAKTGRRVIVAAADAHLYFEAYATVVGYKPAFREFSAPDGAPIHRTMLLVRGTRSRWCGEDSGPIEAAAGWVAQWAVKHRLETVGVVTFAAKEAVVRRKLFSCAPDIAWQIGHYGAMRGLDRWKSFDGVATLGDPRPNMDHVSRELGGAGEEVGEKRLDRADDRARAELEQAHGRLRTVHRDRPGFALHVGALLPAGWREPIAFRRPPEGRPRRAAAEGLGELVTAAGGQRAAALAVGRSLSTVQRWLSGEATPQAADLDLLRRAGTERRPTEGAGGDPVRATYINLYVGDTGSVDIERIGGLTE